MLRQTGPQQGANPGPGRAPAGSRPTAVSRPLRYSRLTVGRPGPARSAAPWPGRHAHYLRSRLRPSAPCVHRLRQPSRPCPPTAGHGAVCATLCGFPFRPGRCPRRAGCGSCAPSPSCRPTSQRLVRTCPVVRVPLSATDLWLSPVSDVPDGDVRCQFDQAQALGGDVQDAQVRDDPLHGPLAGEGQGALLDDVLSRTRVSPCWRRYGSEWGWAAVVEQVWWDDPGARGTPFFDLAVAYLACRRGDLDRAGQWKEMNWDRYETGSARIDVLAVDACLARRRGGSRDLAWVLARLADARGAPLLSEGLDLLAAELARPLLESRAPEPGEALRRLLAPYLRAA